MILSKSTSRFCSCMPPLLATIFCNHLVKLLQKIVASLEKPTHRMLLSFVIILQSLCSPNEDFRWPNERLGTNFRSTLQMASTRFGLRSFVTRPLFRTNLHYRKFVTTFNHEFEFRLKVWWVATIFVIILQKLLQKIIASTEKKPTHRMLLLSFVIILQSLFSPNEDFGSPNEHLGMHFRSNFKGT
jgi:hypothetical protein